MTKKETIHWLSTSIQACDHEDKLDIIYRKRLYSRCKVCLSSTAAALLAIGLDRPKTISDEYAYTALTKREGYQPEVFHAANHTTLWSGPLYTTKQGACDAAKQYIAALEHHSATPRKQIAPA